MLLQLRIAKFLTTDETGQERFLTEYGWTWRQVTPLISEYKQNVSSVLAVFELAVVQLRDVRFAASIPGRSSQTLAGPGSSRSSQGPTEHGGNMTILPRISSDNIHDMCPQYAALPTTPAPRGSRDGIGPRFCAGPGASGLTLADPARGHWGPLIARPITSWRNPRHYHPIVIRRTRRFFATIEVSGL